MITICEEEVGRIFVRNTDEGPRKMCYFREQLFAFKQICRHEKEASIICKALAADKHFCLMTRSREGTSIWIEVREAPSMAPVEPPKIPEQRAPVRTAVAKDDTAQLSIRHFNQSLPERAKETVVPCSDGLIIFRHARV